MRLRTLVVLLVILGILSAAGTWLFTRRAQKTRSDLGRPLMAALPTADITAIDMVDSGGRVSLRQEAEHWVVAERFQYPADFGRIRDLVRRLKDAKIGREFEASDEVRARLSLKDPTDGTAPAAETGLLISLMGNEGRALDGLILGKTRPVAAEGGGPAGQYVMRPKEPRVYLIDQVFTGNKADPVQWLNKSLLQLPAGEIREIEALTARGAREFLLQRPERGKDLALRFPQAPPRPLNKVTVNRLAGALASLRIEDVAGRESAFEAMGVAEVPSVVFHTFEGMFYRVYPQVACEDDCHLRLEMGYEAREREKVSETADGEPGSEPAPPQAGPEEEELAQEAERLSASLSPWVFKIPRWQHEALVTRLEGLLEKEAPAAEKP